MRQIKYKSLPPLGCGEVQIVAKLCDFLGEIPTLFYMGYVPSLPVINAFLSEGRRDAGMGGGAEWEPFVVEPSEYEELVNYWREKRSVSRARKLAFAEVPEYVKSKLDWYAWVMYVEMHVPYEENLRLMEEEAELNHLNREATKSGDEGASLTAVHFQWYRAAEALREFVQPYIEAYNDSAKI